MTQKGLPLKEVHLDSLVLMVIHEGQEEEEHRTVQNIEITELRLVRH